MLFHFTIVAMFMSHNLSIELNLKWLNAGILYTLSLSLFVVSRPNSSDSYGWLDGCAGLK